MCTVCGCSNTGPGHALRVQPRTDQAGMLQLKEGHATLHFGAGAARVSVPGMSQARAIKLESDILGANNQVAEQNRARFDAHGLTVLNLLSSPGSGKTTLLCATIEALRKRSPALQVAVIEGDQQTSFDAERIRASGAPAIQVNTGKGCHLVEQPVEHRRGQRGLLDEPRGRAPAQGRGADVAGADLQLR